MLIAIAIIRPYPQLAKLGILIAGGNACETLAGDFGG